MQLLQQRVAAQAGEPQAFERARAVAQIAPEKVRALFEEFHKAEFFWLFDKYSAIETAGPPMHITTVAFDGHTKTVRNYAGENIGMPEIVYELEHAIDEAANTGSTLPATRTARASERPSAATIAGSPAA